MITTQPTPDPLAFDQLLARSWALYKRNWIVSLPPFIAMGVILVTLAILVSAVIFGVVGGFAELLHPSQTAVVALVLAYLAFLAVTLMVAWWSFLATYGMADAAWERGTATLADGFEAFRTRWGASFVAYFGIFGLAIAALILALPTLGISFLALILFTMYVVPAVVSGHRRGFEAIGESFRLVRRFLLPSIITLIVLLGIQYGIGMIGGFGVMPLQFAMMPATPDGPPQMPPIGLLLFSGTLYLAALLAGLAYSGFYALALVGMYRSLAAQPPVAPPGAQIVPGQVRWS